MMNEKFEAARLTIKKINWGFQESNKPSHSKLLFEFLRRGSLFLDFLSVDENSRPAVFSASEKSDIHLSIDVVKICSELELIKNESLVKWTCLNYLEWAFLADQNIPIALEFQNLYEPVIKLFERGGKIRYHHGELVCGKIGWSRNLSAKFSLYQPEDIRDEVLDEMDK